MTESILLSIKEVQRIRALMQELLDEATSTPLSCGSEHAPIRLATLVDFCKLVHAHLQASALANLSLSRTNEQAGLFERAWRQGVSFTFRQPSKLDGTICVVSLPRADGSLLSVASASDIAALRELFRKYDNPDPPPED